MLKDVTVEVGSSAVINIESTIGDLKYKRYLEEVKVLNKYKRLLFQQRNTLTKNGKQALVDMILKKDEEVKAMEVAYKIK